MQLNEKLLEQPDHGHYAVCASRKDAIEKFSLNVFVYTTGISLILICITWFGVNIAAVSWIPSLFGEATELPHLFVQTAELIAFAFISFVGYGRRKLMHIIIFFIYIIMVLACIFNGSTIDIITFIIGAIGIILTAPCFKNYSDYNQLRNTEGWPHFNIRYTESLEHPAYTSRYVTERRPAEPVKPKVTVSAKPAAPAPEMEELAAPAYTPPADEMPELESISMSVPDMPEENDFVPDAELSDSPFDLQ